MTTVAIMQPYFAPYAGYFRLIARADVFVVFDCVQFPRRGYVHRNRLRTREGRLEWATLPLAKAPRETAITDLHFSAEAPARWSQLTQRFPALDDQRLPEPEPDAPATPWIVESLASVCEQLTLAFTPHMSSALNIPTELRGQDRILAICAAFGATAYLNAPGGRDLYDAEVFETCGVALSFLEPWRGNTDSVLQQMSDEGAAATRAAILKEAPMARAA